MTTAVSHPCHRDGNWGYFTLKPHFREDPPAHAHARPDGTDIGGASRGTSTRLLGGGDRGKGPRAQNSADLTGPWKPSGTPGGPRAAHVIVTRAESLGRCVHFQVRTGSSVRGAWVTQTGEDAGGTWPSGVDTLAAVHPLPPGPARRAGRCGAHRLSPSELTACTWVTPSAWQWQEPGSCHCPYTCRGGSWGPWNPPTWGLGAPAGWPVLLSCRQHAVWHQRAHPVSGPCAPRLRRPEQSGTRAALLKRCLPPWEGASPSASRTGRSGAASTSPGSRCSWRPPRVLPQDVRARALGAAPPVFSSCWCLCWARAAGSSPPQPPQPEAPVPAPTPSISSLPKPTLSHKHTHETVTDEFRLTATSPHCSTPGPPTHPITRSPAMA